MDATAKDLQREKDYARLEEVAKLMDTPEFWANYEKNGEELAKKDRARFVAQYQRVFPNAVEAPDPVPTLWARFTAWLDRAFTPRERPVVAVKPKEPAVVPPVPPVRGNQPSITHKQLTRYSQDGLPSYRPNISYDKGKEGGGTGPV